MGMNNWITFKFSYGSKKSKKASVSTSEQDLRNFLWVGSSKVSLILSVTKVWYHLFQGSWAPCCPVPFPQKPLVFRVFVRGASEILRVSGHVGLLPPAASHTMQPHFMCWDVPLHWGSVAGPRGHAWCPETTPRTVFSKTSNGKDEDSWELVTDYKRYLLKKDKWKLSVG